MTNRTEKLLELLSLQLTLAAMGRADCEFTSAARQRHTNLERRIEGRQFELGLLKDTVLTAKVGLTLEPFNADKGLATRASLWSNEEFMERAFEASVNGLDIDFVVNTGESGTKVEAIHEILRSRAV